MPLNEIKSLLKVKMGLNAAKIGDSSVEHAVNNRLASTHTANIKDYYHLLQSDNKELRELIEEIVVPETWFFRNKIPFEFFARHIKQHSVTQYKSNTDIRILSIPCSTGEEPYSIAMELCETGIDIGKIKIDAIDISRKALMKAQKGEYNKNSLRETDPSIVEKYFGQQDNRFVINDKIKRMVSFKQSNILVGPLSPKPDYYDAVFCRNLLIYFDRELQNKTVEKIYRALKKGGLLFVGHAESSHIDTQFFQLFGDKQAFAYQRMDKQGKFSLASYLNEKTDDKDVQSNWQNVSSHMQGLQNSLGVARSEKRTDNTRKVISITYVRSLIKREKYQEARKLLHDYSIKCPDDAEGVYLMGLVANAEGNTKGAESLLKKAVFLDPDHEPSIKLLVAIAENNRQLGVARSYKDKLQRLKMRKRTQKKKTGDKRK